MKSKRLLCVLIGLAVMFMAVSCRTQPPPVEPEPPVEEEQELERLPDLSSLNAAAERAAAARKLVMDFDGPYFFPAEWEAANSLFTQAEQQRMYTTYEETRDSIARFLRAADALEALAEKTLAKAYENAERELEYARAAAVAAGASVLVPDFLLDADNTVYRALEKYNARDFYGARDSANKALAMYETLTAGLAAYALRWEIVDHRLDGFVRREMDQADYSLDRAVEFFAAGDIASAAEKANEARFLYEMALTAAWEAQITERRASAMAVRQTALDLRANVAVRNDFANAQSIFNNAEAAFRARRFVEAGRLYQECTDMFEAVILMTLERRQAAQEAMARADERIEESEETARSAEIILEGGVE